MNANKARRYGRIKKLVNFEIITHFSVGLMRNFVAGIEGSLSENLILF